MFHLGLLMRFVLLPPNSTDICQPLDVAFFKPLKMKWREVLDEWKYKNRGGVSKDVFPRLLNKCLVSIGQEATVNNVKSGFKAAGVVPLNRDQVLKRLAKKKDPQSKDSASNDSNHSFILNSFEAYIEEARKSETTPLRKQKKKKN